MIELIPYSPKGERSLSEFHGREMLFEYVTDQLDPIRASAIKTLIDKSPEMKNEVDSIRRALAYCDTLSRISFSSQKIEQLQSSETSVDQFLRKSKVYNWPGGLRIGLESLFVVSVVFFFAMMVPWNTLLNVLKQNQGAILLSEVSREVRDMDQDSMSKIAGKKLPADQQATAQAAQNQDQFSDEGMPVEDAPAPALKIETVVQIPALRTNSAEQQLPSPLKNPQTESAPLPTNEGKDLKERVAGAREPADARLGFLHKGRLVLTNVGATSPKVVDVVTGLGGRKAGQVPLGWQKGKGSYFHFTIPEAKYEELLNSLKGFGDLRISKDPHDRVMPQGIVRVIIDVEEAPAGIKKESVEFIPDPPAADPAASEQ